MIVIWHWISLSLYALTVVYASRCMFHLHRFHTQHEGFHRTRIIVMLMFFCTFLIMQATMFVALQIDWIMNNYNSVVGESISILWLLFDYFNGFVLLSFCVALLTYLKWDFCVECNFVEKDDTQKMLRTGIIVERRKDSNNERTDQPT